MSLNKYLERAICCHRRITHPLQRPCANILVVLLSSLAQPSPRSSLCSLWLAAIEITKTTVYDLNAKEINQHAAYPLIRLFSRLSMASAKVHIRLGNSVKDSIPERHWIKKFSKSDFLRFLKEVKWLTSRVSLKHSLFSSNIQRKKQDGKDYRSVLAFMGHCSCSQVFYRPPGWFRKTHCIPCLSFPICKVWMLILTSFLKVLLELCMMSTS